MHKEEKSEEKLSGEVCDRKGLEAASLTPLASGYLAAILLLGILEWHFLEQVTDFQPQSPNSAVLGWFLAPHSPDLPRQHPLLPLPRVGSQVSSGPKDSSWGSRRGKKATGVKGRRENLSWKQSLPV